MRRILIVDDDENIITGAWRKSVNSRGNRIRLPAGPLRSFSPDLRVRLRGSASKRPSWPFFDASSRFIGTASGGFDCHFFAMNPIITAVANIAGPDQDPGAVEIYEKPSRIENLTQIVKRLCDCTGGGLASIQYLPC